MQSTSPLIGLILIAALLSSCDFGKPPQQAEPIVSSHTPELPARIEPPDTIADATGPSTAESLAAICDVSESDIPNLHEILLSVIPGDKTLQDDQQKWLDKTAALCSQPEQDTRRCCRSAIEWRNDEIRRLPYSTNMLFVYDNEGDTVRMDGIMQEHNLELTVVPAFDGPEDCKDRQLLITRRSVSPEDWQQRFELPGLDYSLAPDGKILLDGREIADKPEDLIWVEDFNFDGHQDFAIFSGYAGTKGAQTWHIFLFDPDRNDGFSYAPALSELTYAQIFEVSHDEGGGGSLHTFNKNSACSSTNSDWQVINNIPQEITRFTLDCDHISEDGRMGTLAVSQEWREGQWHTLDSEFTLNEDEDKP